MKPCHAAALTLVGFWLIMRPPFSGGSVDLKLPLKQWWATGVIFDTAAECEKARLNTIHEMEVKKPWLKQDELKTFTNPDAALKGFEHLKAEYEHSECVSSEDPRL